MYVCVCVTSCLLEDVYVSLFYKIQIGAKFAANWTGNNKWRQCTICVRGHLIFFVGIASPSHTKQNKPKQLGTATAIIQRIENVDKRYTKNRWSGMHIMNTSAFCNNFAAAVGCVCVFDRLSRGSRLHCYCTRPGWSWRRFAQMF